MPKGATRTARRGTITVIEHRSQNGQFVSKFFLRSKGHVPIETAQPPVPQAQHQSTGAILATARIWTETMMV